MGCLHAVAKGNELQGQWASMSHLHLGVLAAAAAVICSRGTARLISMGLSCRDWMAPCMKTCTAQPHEQLSGDRRAVCMLSAATVLRYLSSGGAWTLLRLSKE